MTGDKEQNTAISDLSNMEQDMTHVKMKSWYYCIWQPVSLQANVVFIQLLTLLSVSEFMFHRSNFTEVVSSSFVRCSHYFASWGNQSSFQFSSSKGLADGFSFSSIGFANSPGYFSPNFALRRSNFSLEMPHPQIGQNSPRAL
jgi:hypothetical protein